MIYTNAPPAVAPHGALKSLFGTNPICFGTPSGSNIPFILDTSVSMINRGKIRVAARQGVSIPKNCTSGTCGTCLVTLVRGHVPIPDEIPPGLDEYLLGEGGILSCCLYPSSSCEIDVRPPL